MIFYFLSRLSTVHPFIVALLPSPPATICSKPKEKRYYIEQFYREAKGWLGLKEYQVRKKDRCYRHFILVFTAYTFIIYQKLMGGLRKRYANKPLTTFTETLEAFLTGVSYRFFCWLRNNIEFFAAHKSTRGSIWG